MRPRPLLFAPVVVLFITVFPLLSAEPFQPLFTCAEADLAWAGMDCSEREPCPVYLELTGITANAGKILVSGNLHSTSATLSSILLRSEDGGVSWKEPASRVQGAAVDQVQFLDRQHAWAAGETQYPLARDPFFLISTDAGETWHQRPVREDGGPGSIQAFHFDSPSHGNLIVDAGRQSPGGRFLTYESETSGESWMLRALSEKAPVLRGQTQTEDASGWRLRTSKDGKLWQLEQYQGDRWIAAASFPVQVASCQAQPEERKEPQ